MYAKDGATMADTAQAMTKGCKVGSTFCTCIIPESCEFPESCELTTCTQSPLNGYMEIMFTLCTTVPTVLSGISQYGCS